MKVFVTGSTGLLGNNAVRQLRAAGHEVVGLVRSQAKGERLLGDTGVHLVTGDMLDVAGFAPALAGCDAVIHTAAYFREYYQPGDHAEMLERINITGTLELLAAAQDHGVKRFVQVSSGGTVGRKADGSPGDEDTPPDPVQTRNLYFKSKLDGDAKIRDWVAGSSLEVVEILPGWMWGPGDAAPTAAGQMALDFVNGKIPVIPAGGTCTVDARDVAAAAICALSRGASGERYLVAGAFYTLAQVLAALEEVTGIRGPRRTLPHFAVMTYAWLSELWARLTGGEVLVSREGVRLMRAAIEVSSAKAERELGVTFRPLSDTIADVVAWYRAHDMLPAAKAEAQAVAAG